MEFQILVSTVRDRIQGVQKIIDSLNGIECVSFIVVQQLLDLGDTPELVEQRNNLLKINQSKLKVIVDDGIGLTRSRNIAIKHSTSKYLIIADDDIYYDKNCFLNLLSFIERNPDSDVIISRVRSPGGKPHKKYSNKQELVSKIAAISVSSVEIILKREKGSDLSYRFDESFGLGTNLPACEELLFISALLDLKKKIVYFPEYLVVHPEDSSGKLMVNDKELAARGAAFNKVFHFGFVFVLAFWVKNFLLKNKKNKFKKLVSLYNGFINVRKD
jgi:glycosyltransferase involved in cell wall biosynthesis